jgi:mannuronan synthase
MVMTSDSTKAVSVKGQSPIAGPLDAGSEHAKTNIPFQAIIDGRMFNGKTLSLTSAVVAGLAAFDFGGVDRLATFNFPFGSYAISVVAEVKVSKIDAATGEYRLDFIEPTGNHLPTLRYILNSYVSGDVVSLGGVLSQRDKAAAPSAAKNAPKLTLSQRLGVAVRALGTVALTVTLLAIFASLAFDRLLTKNVNDLAAFSQGGEPMRAIVSGQLSYLNANAIRGDVIYSILTSKRETVNVVNPCDCTVSFSTFELGSTILTGETVAELVRPNAVQSVAINLESEDARRLLSGDIAQFSLAGKTVNATSRTMTISQIPGSDKVRASFTLDYTVEKVASGTPVPVRIINGTFAGLHQKFTTLLTMKPTQWLKIEEKQQVLNYGKDSSFNSLWWRRYPPLATVAN